MHPFRISNHECTTGYITKARTCRPMVIDNYPGRGEGGWSYNTLASKLDQLWGWESFCCYVWPICWELKCNGIGVGLTLGARWKTSVLGSSGWWWMGYGPWAVWRVLADISPCWDSWDLTIWELKSHDSSIPSPKCL